MAVNPCPTCGIEMKPLLTSFFCPDDCDEKIRRGGMRCPDGTWLFGVSVDWSIPDFMRCPECDSCDIEDFRDCLIGDKHCWKCGHVWYNLPKGQ